VAAGTDSNPHVYRESSDSQNPSNTQQPNSPFAAVQQPQAPPPGIVPPTPATVPAAASQLHFNPATATMKQGDVKILGLAVSNVNDLYSIPLLIHYNPSAIQVEEVRDGGFLSGGTESTTGSQPIAIVQHIDSQKGDIVVSATRNPNTPGVSGSGTLLGLVIRAVAPGTSAVQVLQVNARDSQQRTLPMVSQEATIQVQ
jgi:general secretion pathway protein D